MARCPVCGEYVDRPASSVIQGEKLLPPEMADASREVYVQLECPSCEAIMGYLGVAAAAASADVEDLADAHSEGALGEGRSKAEPEESSDSRDDSGGPEADESGGSEDTTGESGGSEDEDAPWSENDEDDGDGTSPWDPN